MEKQKRLLVIDNATGDYYQPMSRFPKKDFPMEMDVVNYVRGESVDNLNRYTHIIATGCTKSICQIEPWMLKLAQLFEEALALDLNILAICFSHQLLARTVAGESWVRRRKEPEFGWVEQEVLADDFLFGKKGDRIWGFVSHFEESPESGAAMLEEICKEDSGCAQFIQNPGHLKDSQYWNTILKRFLSL